MTKYNDTPTLAIYYCDFCDACVATVNTDISRKCSKCPSYQKVILLTNDYILWRNKQDEIAAERKHYINGYKYKDVWGGVIVNSSGKAVVDASGLSHIGGDDWDRLNKTALRYFIKTLKEKANDQKI